MLLSGFRLKLVIDAIYEARNMEEMQADKKMCLPMRHTNGVV